MRIKALQLTGVQHGAHGFGIMGSEAQLAGRSGRPAAERPVRWAAWGRWIRDVSP